MFSKSKFSRALVACFLMLSIVVPSLADTIRLKNGSIIKGRIVSFGEGQFTVVIGEGARQRQMTFFADEVEAIEFDVTPVQTSGNSKITLPTNSDPVRKDPNTQVITVGQTEPRPTPTPMATPAPTPSKQVIVTDNTTAKTTPTPTPSGPAYTNTNPTPPRNNDNSTKPITLSVKVLADNTANGWSNSGWVVRKGQRIRVTGRGQVSLGNGRYSSAAGIGSLDDKDKLLQKEATGGLIAVIGDDNNDFIFIGASKEFVASRDGALFLGVNEGNLDDNSGAFDVTIEIIGN